MGEIADYTAWPGVGLAEVTIPGVSDDRIVRLPSLDAFDIGDPATSADQRLTYMFTRQRIDPATPNESPAERFLTREFDVPTTRSFSITGEARVSGRASEAALTTLFGDEVVVYADRALRGSPASRGASAFDDDPTTVWQTPFDEVVGAAVTIEHATTIDADVLRLTWVDDGLHSIPTEITVTSDEFDVRTLQVPSTAPVDGRSSVELEIPGYRSAVSTITVTGVDQRTTPEYFSRLPKVLPLGISGIRFDDEAPITFDRNADLDTGCRDDLLMIDGASVPMRIIATMGDAIDRKELALEPCGSELTLAPGLHRLQAGPGAATGIDLDRIVLDSDVSRSPAVVTPAPSVTTNSVADTRLQLTVEPSEADSWLVLAQSWNAGWTATVDGESLGAPVLIDGYANGWLLSGSDAERTVVLDWTPQRIVTIALWFSLVVGLLVIALLVRTRRDPVPVSLHSATEGVHLETGSPTTQTVRWRNSWTLAVVWIATIAFLAGPIPAIGAGVVLLLAPTRGWVPLAVVLVFGSIAAGAIMAFEWRYDFPPGPDWPSRFTWTAPLVWLCVAAVATVAIMPNGVKRAR